MNTTIEKAGNVYLLRCKYHGQLEDGSERDLIEYLQKKHEASCNGPEQPQR